MNDQATQLRRLVAAAAASPAAPAAGVAAPAPARRPVPRRAPAPAGLAAAVAVTSGKGGVGKSNLAVNLAVRLARLGRRVCLLDADLGLANADVLCNLTPRLTLEHVVSGRCRLAEALLLAPGGFRLIPGGCGVARLAELGRRERRALLEQLAALERAADTVIIDTSAGISRNVLGFAAAAGRVIVATTPEPTAMTDAYGLIKVLLGTSASLRPELVVNMAGSEEEAGSVHRRMARVSRTFLGRDLPLAGAVPTDPAVREAVRHRMPFALYAPQAPATGAVDALARRLAGLPPPPRAEGFFRRLAAWFS